MWINGPGARHRADPSPLLPGLGREAEQGWGEGCLPPDCPWLPPFVMAGPRVAPDVAHSVAEQHFIAVGRIPAGEEGAGRAAFVAFTIRQVDGARLIRPISARFMHAKEVRRYEDFEAEEGSGSADG